MITFLVSPLGRWLLLGGALALVIVAGLLWVYGQGEAAAAAAAATLALERTAAAARARAKVIPEDEKDMADDPFNRRNRRS